MRIACLILMGVAGLGILPGCSTTIRKEQEAQVAILKASQEASERALGEFQGGQLPPKHDLHLWIRMGVVNQALGALDKTTFKLQNDPTIEVTLGSVRLGTLGVIPTVQIEASAVRGELAAEIAVTALLRPIDGNAGHFRIEVLSFVPKLTWHFFEFTKSDFVKALLSAELRQVTAQLPVIQLPIEQAVAMGGSNRQEAIRVQTSDRPSYLDMNVSYPSNDRITTLKVQRYLFLSSGVHIFGELQ